MRDIRETRALKRRYDVMVCRLRKDGLLAKNGAVTKKGLALIISRLSRRRAIPERTRYPAEESKMTVLVTFDVPEKMRECRDWIRSVLKHLGFEMLHKSVWLGKIKIPKELLQDLRKWKISEYIEIVEISKGGTVERIKI